MMITSTTTNKDKEKKETAAFKEIEKPSSATSSRHWSSAGFRNPRIVRVSRTFGGKDRHSKVCTVRGLRDRRIRLSVPTAVQLYDLQDRLGLAQPSKVIDWLIDNSKPDIDKLPPLHFPPLLPHHLDHHHHPINKSNGHDLAPPFASLYHAPPPDNNLQLGVLPQNIINNVDHHLHHHHNDNNNNPTAAIFAPPPYNYQYYAGDQTVGSSRMIANNMITTTSSSHVLQNYSLMSSLLLHNNNNSNSSSANELLAPYNNNSSLAKSFPAIFNNPRLLSSQASLFGNRLEKDNG